jgi:hypothetical protein
MVNSRSVLQLIFEVPIEQADETMRKLGGYPLPAEARWVGIALAPAERDKVVKLEKPHQKFGELPLSAQAAIRCSDPEFVTYLANAFGFLATSFGEDVAQFIREKCNVTSRSEFNTDADAANRWLMLESAYQGWLLEQKYKDVRR